MIVLKQITWLDGTILPDDYDVIHDGEIVGRIHRMNADRELWRWTMRGWDGPTGGVADNLDEAKVAFRRAWGGA
jgi:hypothetical protein